MSQLPEDQLKALQSLTAALQGTDIKDFLLSAAGIKNQDNSTKQPSSSDTKQDPPRITQKPMDSFVQSQQASKPVAPTLATYLAPHAKNYIQREVNTTKSQFIPSFLKMYYVLNQMDQVLSDNYYARRALVHFYPSVSRIYYGVLAWYQTLLVMRHRRALPSDHLSFLESFEEAYPPGTLAIAGPLLPFFKAVTSSSPENARFRAVHPSYHNQAFNGATLQERMRDNTSHAFWYMPDIQALCYMHHELMKDFPGVLALGVDDSHSAGNKTVTYTAVNGYDKVVDLQHHPRSQYRKHYFPFECHRAQDSAPNATVDPLDLSRISFFGYNSNGPYPRMDVDDRRSMTKCGLAEPYMVSKDLTAQFKNNFSRIRIPEVDGTFSVSTVSELFLMEEDMSWFSEIAATMAAYAKFFPGSGTLGDCSLEGPRTGQYLARIQAPRTLPTTPEFYGNESIVHQFNAGLHTTISEEDDITELLARYTQINTRMYPTHPWLGTMGSAATRNGPFWDIRPVFTASTIDEAWIQTPQVIKASALDRPDKISS
jgi:hypothetical protein